MMAETKLDINLERSRVSDMVRLARNLPQEQRSFSKTHRVVRPAARHSPRLLKGSVWVNLKEGGHVTRL